MREFMSKSLKKIHIFPKQPPQKKIRDHTGAETEKTPVMRGRINARPEKRKSIHSDKNEQNRVRNYF
jgi:hypothetical protein